MKFNFLLVYACLLWFLAIILISSDLATFKNGSKMKKNHDLSKYTVYDYSKNTMIIYGVLSVIVLLALVFGNQQLEMNIINLAIIAMTATEFITAKVNYKLYVNDKEIIYENEVYRIKNLKPAKKVKRFGKNYEITTFDGKAFSLNKTNAEIINSLIEEKREEKQARKKR